MAVNTSVTQFIEDSGACFTSIVGTMGEILSLFLQPPLIYFVAIGMIAGVGRVVTHLYRKNRKV